jgi:hypothetical protein
MNQDIRLASTFCAFLLFILNISCQTRSLEQRLKSTDPQVRCDAFYEVFGSGELRSDFQSEKLHGKSTKQIYELLGKPSRVGVLEYKGVNWMEISYLFDECPTNSPQEFKEMHKKGWRIRPSLIFRNGISVTKNEWARETGVFSTSIPPEHLRFKDGGQLP